ncbi:Ribonuclease Z [Lentibacillus sp. JNUCC-1]|nr:Ribonuclease Z [Lentibacillus sp. JNUCC-1]
MGYPLTFVELYEGEIFSDQQFTVYCQRLEHGVPSYGFRIEEKDKMGELLVDQLKDADIQPGPVYQQIKDNPSTTLPDGRIIHREDYIGPPKQGRHLALIGDTRLSRDYMDLIKNVDVLVHEATFSQQDAHLAHRYFHTAIGDAAHLASEASAAQLVLTHISSRYHMNDHPQLLAEAKDVFPNTIIAHDFMTVPVSDQGRRKK